MRNYKNFIEKLAAKLASIGIKQISGQLFTSKSLFEFALNYIRNNDDFLDRLIEAIPTDLTKDYSQQIKYFNLFMDGSNVAFLVIIKEAISFGNYIVVQALANALGINIKLNDMGEELILLTSENAVTIDISLADNLLSIVQPKLLESPYLTENIYHINSLDSLKEHLMTIREILHPSLIETSKLDSIIVSELYAIRELRTQVPGYRIEDVAGDGNCLLHVVALQLRAAGIMAPDGTEYTHLRLREIAVNYIDTHRTDYSPVLAGLADDILPSGSFSDSEEVLIGRLQLHQELLNGNIEAYLAEMRQNHVWADHLVIQALADAFNLIIVIHPGNGPINEISPNVHHHPQETHHPIRIHALLESDHYRSMTCVEISSDAVAAAQISDPPTQPIPTVASEDSLEWEELFATGRPSMYISDPDSD